MFVLPHLQGENAHCLRYNQCNVIFGMSHLKRSPRATDLTNCPKNLSPRQDLHPFLPVLSRPACLPPYLPPTGKSPGAIIKSVFTMSNTAEERSGARAYTGLRSVRRLPTWQGPRLTTRALKRKYPAAGSQAQPSACSCCRR